MKTFNKLSLRSDSSGSASSDEDKLRRKALQSIKKK